MKAHYRTDCTGERAENAHFTLFFFYNIFTQTQHVVLLV
jgi:hypothetical protein